jgi:hypothetical protein
MEIEAMKDFLICTPRRCCYSDQIREDEMGKYPEREGERINAYKILAGKEGKGGGVDQFNKAIMLILHVQPVQCPSFDHSVNVQ